MNHPYTPLASRWLKTLKIIFMMLVGLLAFGPAFADSYIAAPGNHSTWTVYAYGNAQAVSDTFRALANFAASNTFRSLVLMIGMIGVISVGVSSGFNGQIARSFVSYIMVVMLTIYVLFGFKAGGALIVRVEVQDVVDSTWKAPVDVPAVVGIPASVISEAGFQIMKQIEASFPLPDGMKMSNGAPFNLATALINDASKAKITDSNLASSLSMYVQDCFIPSVARGEKDAQSLLVSKDFLGDLEVTNKALLVNTFLPNGTPTLVSCQEAYAALKTAIEAEDSAGAYLTDASAWAGTQALSVVNSAADTVAQWAMNGDGTSGSSGGAAMVKQAAVLSSFTGAFKQTAAQTGNSDFLTGLAVTQATNSQVSSWIVGAEVFNRMMGYIFAVLQVFVYAITPLIMAASLIPSLGPSLLKNFAQILLWLAIWQPMLAIVNFIIVAMQWSDLNGILGGKANFGFSLSSMGVITEKTSNMRAAATFVGTMVPALAWAMVKGSLDFSRIIGSAVGESFAQGAANTMTTGNFSLNNGSMDSFTANKHSVGQTFDAGRGFSSSGNGGINNKNDLGGSFNPTSGDTSAGVTASGSMGSSANAGTGRATGQGNQGSQTLAGSTSAGVSSNTSDGVSAGNTNASGQSDSISGNVGINAGLQLLRGAGAKGSPGAGGGGVGGDGKGGHGSVLGDAVAKSEREFANPLAVGVSANTGYQKSANQSNTDQRSHQVSSTQGANAARNGSDTVQASRSASDMEQANRGEQSNRGQNLNYSTFAPRQEQAAVHAQALHFENSRFAPKSAEGSVGAQLFYNQAPTTDLGKAAQELGTSGHVAAKVADQEMQAARKMDEHASEEKRLEAEARTRRAAFAAEANNQMALDGQKVDRMSAAAYTTPGERVGEGLREMHDQFRSNPYVQAVGGMATEGLDKANEFISGFGGLGSQAPAAAAPASPRSSGTGGVQHADDEAHSPTGMPHQTTGSTRPPG